MHVQLQIPADHNLPQLREVLSGAVMRALFDVHLDAGWSLDRFALRGARYDPSLSCLLSYRFKCNHVDGRRAALTLHARAFVPGASTSSFSGRPPLVTPVGRFPSYLPQANLALWCFPEDPGLIGMSSLWRHAGAIFDGEDVLDERPWSGRRPRFDVARLRYVPSKRCTLRYGSTAVGRPGYFDGHVFDRHHKVQVLHEQLHALWRWCGTAPELDVPQPLGFDRRLNVLWTKAPAGQCMLAMADVAELPRLLRRIAAAMAALHRAPVRAPRNGHAEQLRAELIRARQALLHNYPALERQICVALDCLVAAPPAPSSQESPVHGNLHCNQVFIDGRRITFANFEHFAMGDPLLDLGRFLARFRVHFHDKVTHEEADRLQQVLLSTYEILVPWKLDRARLGWFVAACMVTEEALRSLKRLSISGPGQVARLLALTARITQGRSTT